MRVFFALLLVFSVIACSQVAIQEKPAPLSPVDSSLLPACLATARAQASDAFDQGASRMQVRQQLEVEAATCFDPTLPPEAAWVVGVVSSDRARLALDFLEERLTLADYRAALDDRQRKLTRLLEDPEAQRALQRGDADGDLVPDVVDRCPQTPYATPTDEHGCPRSPPASGDDERLERLVRRTLADARFLYNPSCEGAPKPQIPMPLEWGRGPQTQYQTHGFNIAVTKVSGQLAGCEVFYEIQFRFIDPNPGNPAMPQSKIVTVVFSGGEDLLTDPRRAVFGLPMMESIISPGRAEARDAFAYEYARATWRVRAVNGSNVTSGWSPFVTQGPAYAGVEG